MDVKECNAHARELKTLLGLRSDPVGVIFDEGARPVTNSVIVTGHRYCQALMRARRGEAVSLGSEGIACPAAARAFGFKGLPDGLRNGKGLVSFGIVSNSGCRESDVRTHASPGGRQGEDAAFVSGGPRRTGT